LTFSITGGADSALFNIGSETGVLSFKAAPVFASPTDVGADGTYEVTVQVSDGNGGTDSQDIAVTVTEIGSVNAGFLAYLQAIGIVDNESFTSDPDNDKVFTLIEYLMGSNANSPASSPGIVASIVMVEGQEYLGISFPRNTAIADFSLTTQFSTSPGFNDAAEGIVVSTEDLGGGIERVTQRSPIPAGGGQVFARVRGGD